MTVVVAWPTEVGRYGLERMLQSAPSVASVLVGDPGEQENPGSSCDVLIGDLHEVGRRRGTAGPGTKLLLVVDCSRRDELLQAVATPAHGYLDLADVSTRTLDVALRELSTGGLPMPARLVQAMMTQLRGEQPTTPAVQATLLTPREHDVLALLGQGLSNKQIARRIGISAHGVKRLVSNVLAKLNCPNRTLAVARALREGLVHPAPEARPPRPAPVPERDGVYTDHPGNLPRRRRPRDDEELTSCTASVPPVRST